VHHKGRDAYRASSGFDYRSGLTLTVEANLFAKGPFCSTKIRRLNERLREQAKRRPIRACKTVSASRDVM
jgi:hypothetical protein